MSRVYVIGGANIDIQGYSHKPLMFQDSNVGSVSYSYGGVARNIAENLVMVDVNGQEDLLFSQNYACPDCGISIEEIEPRQFSFNSPFGACEDCKGLGFRQVIDLNKIIVDRNQPLSKCGINKVAGWSYDAGMARMFYRAVARKFGVDLDINVCDMPKGMLDMILYGTNKEKIDIDYVRSGTTVVGQMV